MSPVQAFTAGNRVINLNQFCEVVAVLDNGDLELELLTNNSRARYRADPARCVLVGAVVRTSYHGQHNRFALDVVTTRFGSEFAYLLRDAAVGDKHGHSTVVLTASSEQEALDYVDIFTFKGES